MNLTQQQDQHTQSDLWAIVPAAGIGARMGVSKPKQYLSLAGKTILEQTLLRLLSCHLITGIVVAISAEDPEWVQLAISKDSRIHTVVGGTERADSVLNGLNYLASKIHAQDFVLVHDAARPCIQPTQIEFLVRTLKNHPVGGILALPASDTLKQVDAESKISKTIDRQLIWQAQTPQVFRYQLLLDSLCKAKIEKKLVTDESSAVEIYGYTARVVEGSRDNIKITRPEDLKLAEFIFLQQTEA